MLEGVYGYGSGDARDLPSHKYPHPLVRVGSRNRRVFVDSAAREKLEASARKVSKRAQPSRRHFVGEFVRIQDRLWQIAAVCYRCHDTGWTRLEAQRGLDEDGPLPSPRSRPCEHFGRDK